MKGSLAMYRLLSGLLLCSLLLVPSVPVRSATLPQPLPPEPAATSTLPATVEYDSWVAAVIAQVDTDVLYQYEEWLSGEDAALVGGQVYTITTRHTDSGLPIQMATQFVYEHLQGLGLAVEYHNWSRSDHSGRNVIATQPGRVDPEIVYIICAHLDDMPTGSVAPGADDNASGSAAVLMAADLLGGRDFSYTIIYALWTGEEQGMLGSTAWAAEAAAAGRNIAGVINLDMIGYDSDATPDIDLYARSTVPGSVTLTHVLSDVVGLYELDLVPEIFVDVTLGNYSDNRSFWDYGYAAFLAIEDDDDFTPYYHTPSDTLATLNMAYMTDFTRAAVGTLAHLATAQLQWVFLPVVLRGAP